MPVYINNKDIRINLNTANHFSLKDSAALFANTANIATNLLGGVANIVTAIGGLANFILMQAYFGLNNKELRKKISELYTKYKQLKFDLKAEGYRIKLTKPKGFEEFGLHKNNCLEFGSTAVALLNFGMQAGAVGSALYTDVINYNNDQTRAFCHDNNRFQNQTINTYCDTIHPELFDYCLMGSCITSYTLFGGVLAISALEQHFKRVNLERWCKTLDEGVRTLEKIKTQIDIRNEFSRSPVVR